jgi:transcriptional regulator with XRE-family HTH domain
MPAHLSLPYSREKLRDLRERRGLTCSGLARRCTENGHRVSAQHVARIEAGPWMPSAPLLKAIADAMDVTVDDLLDHDRAGAA